jgi:hypothetical protein
MPWGRPPQQIRVALFGFRGDGASRHQCRDEGAEQGLAAAAHVVHDLKEAEIERQFVLRNTRLRTQPGARQRPEALDRIDMDLTEAVAVFAAGIGTVASLGVRRPERYFASVGVPGVDAWLGLSGW